MDNAVVVSDLTKVFDRTFALRGIDLTVRSGTVHALIGENGAGKSTALGVIAGRITKTGGTVSVFGEDLRGGGPRESRRAGVVAIYQELTIIPGLSVEANVFLGQPITRGGFLAESTMRHRYLELCDHVGVGSHPPNTRAGALSVADQQILEILRAVVSDARIILFDEPTASLAVPEREALFTLIRALRDDGVTVVFVSHNLDEVLDISDSLTVFRDGQVVADGARGDFTKGSMVAAMLGQTGDDRVASELSENADGHEIRTAPGILRQSRQTAQPPLLAIADLTVPGAVDGINLELQRGEIIGLGGLVGSGRSTVLRAIAGALPQATGRMWIDGVEVPWPRSVRRALRYGVALIPEDRKAEGLILPMLSMDNIAVSDFRRLSRFGLLSSKSVEQSTADHGAAFGLTRALLERPAWQLSGGNQQKLLLARWRHVTPRVLLADEPTRGIDVGAKAEILRSLERLAGDGLGIVMVSSELEEITAVARRVVVLAEGVQVGLLDAATAPISPHDILARAFRVNELHTHTKEFGDG
ncbi:sugar ABC transporter ATP-binding protein [Microbacterium invictum]|uniref:ABC-type sugar transport system ATPase subunit n=1 Tax=Microbacterium invictum TaxID=515415 RepID=A0AA40SRX5_9MICO|nr:sugar ABC transporter ATP-binding protein [Microbacterium invictum]MBB4141278.1 ABC-type sugar transport system ATPase subunit [Microbacterium invictum]